ncbi:MAG: winged helix-turn-helix domain-containing protein [Pseudomonadota bacterium]
MIEQGPQAHDFNCGVWNTAMINELIKLKFGVSYNERYLARLLKKMGLSYQKARFMSDRLDEKEHLEQRKEWIEKTLPGILKNHPGAALTPVATETEETEETARLVV